MRPPQTPHPPEPRSADGQCQYAADLCLVHARFPAPGIERILHLAERGLPTGRTVHHAGVDQRPDHVPRDQEPVLAHGAKVVLRAVAAKAFAVFPEEAQQPHVVVIRPASDERGEGAVFRPHPPDHGGVARHREDLLPVADDAPVRAQSLDVLRREKCAGVHVEAVKRLLEARPLVLDDPPDKPGLENGPGHARQVPVVRNP